ncbi:rhamnose ABC transporter substrate-binding protein [Steroidobacter sp. S1-65]|uniref:Rhamnose ABC transporter substrate-binding protein n=2 Tax=Steroidobacter gossypii TaxID=2805490 RepID=A0ABS1WSB8_9GAMM|nr:rhamnose ABC transporter substrate-binding protein [Steroidobacter gossypii]MBM0103869.1 rhamnose ABC transporter substrate-binding protein [Steroidobacter gossypii]
MRRRAMLAGAVSLAAVTIAGCGERPQTPAGGGADGRIRIGIVAKSLGNGFFEAVHKGANEAAAALNAEIIFTGPTTPTAEGQIETLNALIAQRVDAIAISANDPDAVVPTLQRAMQRGIKVISYDSAVAKEGRAVHLAPSSDVLIGQTVAQLAAELAPEGKGKVAVVSATPTSTNQNSWLAQMQQALPRYPGLQFAGVVYGDDVSDKSYRETVALVKQHPDLAVIVSLSSVGIVAAAKAIEDQGLTAKVKVTGLGLPSELIGYVRKGVVPKFAIWNPIDLGYAATQVAARLARGEKSENGQEISLERVGTVSFDDDGVGAMAKPFIYDQSNVEQFAAIF